jgi:hypothetical protein
LILYYRKMQRNSIPSTPDSIGSSASSSLNDSTPLWQYVTRVVERSENGGNVKFTCNFCRATFSGSYFRVKAHLLQISGHGVRICSKMTNEEVVRLKRLQDETEARAKTLVPKQVPLPSASSLNRDGESPNSYWRKRWKEKRLDSHRDSYWSASIIFCICVYIVFMD